MSKYYSITLKRLNKEEINKGEEYRETEGFHKLKDEEWGETNWPMNYGVTTVIKKQQEK